MKRIISIAIYIAFLLNVKFAFSQDTPLSFCNDTQIINQQMAAKLSFFKGYKEVLQATLIQSSDGSNYIEILYKTKGVIEKDKKLVSQSDIQTICRELSDITAAHINDDDIYDKGGRRGMIISSMIYAYGYYGWAIPIALNSTEGRTYASSYLLATGAGFFIPFFATRGKNVSAAMANAYSYGNFLGIAHCWNGVGLIAGENLEDQDLIRFSLGLSSITGIAGGIAGYHIAKRNNLTNAHVTATSLGGSWGMVYGYFSPMVFSSDNPRVYFGTSLALSGLGAWAGHSLYKTIPLTTGDVHYTNTAGVLATFVNLSILSNLDVADENTWIASSILSSMGGLTYGIFRAKGYNYSIQQTGLIGLGTTGGALLGLGVSILTIDNPESAFLVSSLSATAGFALTDWFVRKDEPHRKQNAKMKFKLELNPYAIGQFATGKNEMAKNYSLSPEVNLNLNQFATFRLTF